MTERKRVTCPESGHLEEVELDHTPLGLVVVGCSRFPRGTINCARECTHRLDKRLRARNETRERVLVLVAGIRDDAAQIANTLVADLSADDLIVEVAEAGRGAPPPTDYDAIVVGAQIHLARVSRTLLDYIRDYRDDLDAMPSFFYSVSAHSVLQRDAYARKLMQRTGWQPTQCASFAAGDEVVRADIRELARMVADAVPSPLVVPTML